MEKEEELVEKRGGGGGVGRRGRRGGRGGGGGRAVSRRGSGACGCVELLHYSGLIGDWNVSIYWMRNGLVVVFEPTSQYKAEATQPLRLIEVH